MKPLNLPSCKVVFTLCCNNSPQLLMVTIEYQLYFSERLFVYSF